MSTRVSKYGSMGILKDSPPSLIEMVNKIEALPIKHDSKTFSWFKAGLIVMAFTGARVSEVLQLRKAHIKFRMGYADVYPRSDLTNVDNVVFNMITLKRRGEHKRNVIIPINDFNRKVFSWLVIYLFKFSNPEDLLFRRRRDAFNKNLRKWFGIDYHPHLFRKVSATTDGNLGLSHAALKNKYGWSQDCMPTHYAKSDERATYEQSVRVFNQLAIAKQLSNTIKQDNEQDFGGLVLKKRVVEPILIKKRVVL